MIKLKWDRLIIQQQRVGQKGKVTKDEMKEMVQYGASAIFKATTSTVTDELIDDLLRQGEKRTQAMNEKLEEQVKAP